MGGEDGQGRRLGSGGQALFLVWLVCLAFRLGHFCGLPDGPMPHVLWLLPHQMINGTADANPNYHVQETSCRTMGGTFAIILIKFSFEPQSKLGLSKVRRGQSQP